MAYHSAPRPCEPQVTPGSGRSTGSPLEGLRQRVQGSLTITQHIKDSSSPTP